MTHPCVLIEAPHRAGQSYALMTWLQQHAHAVSLITSVEQLDQVDHKHIVLLDGQLNPADCANQKHVLAHHALILLCTAHTELAPEQLIQWRRLGISHVVDYHPDDHTTYLRVAHTLQLAADTQRKLRRADAIAQQMQDLHQAIEQRNQQVEKELYLARQLQQSLLPTPLEDATNADELTFQFSKLHYQSETLRISGLYVPCDALGGDLYDLIHFKNERALSVIMADVSGHGITAGFITAIFKALYHQAAYDNPSPASVLTHMNNELSEIIKTGDYITSVAYYIQKHPDKPGHHIQFSGAGHPFPYLYQAATQQTIRLDKNSMPLGWFGGTEYPEGVVDLQPGDRLLLFTDGITELKNDRDDLFGEERLDTLFTKMARQYQGLFLDYLLQDLSDFTNGQPLDDDLSMLLIEGIGNESAG